MDVKRPDAFVSGAFALVLQISRYAGISPLKFVKQREGWRISMSPRFIVYGYVSVTFMTLIILATVVLDLIVEPAQSVRMRTKTRRVVWLLDVSIQTTLTYFGAAGASGQMQSMISCLTQLQKINKELNTAWPNNNETKEYVLLISWSLITIVMTVADYVLLIFIIQDQNGDAWMCIMHLFYYVCYWIMQFQIFRFVMFILHIRKSFKTINGKLRILAKVAATSDPKKIKSPSIIMNNKKFKKSANTVIDSLAFVGKVIPADDLFIRPAHETVHRLAHTYVSTCDVVREADKQHGAWLLLILGSFFLHLIVTPYYLINNISAKDQTQGTVNTVLQVFWCVFHTADLIILIEPCHLTLEELDVTREQISHLIQYTSSPNDPLAIELDLFYRQLTLNQVSYSPMRVTTLTRSLVITILGSITTYLAIVIQL